MSGEFAGLGFMVDSTSGCEALVAWRTRGGGGQANPANGDILWRTSVLQAEEYKEGRQDNVDRVRSTMPAKKRYVP